MMYGTSWLCTQNGADHQVEVLVYQDHTLSNPSPSMTSSIFVELPSCNSVWPLNHLRNTVSYIIGVCKFHIYITGIRVILHTKISMWASKHSGLEKNLQGYNKYTFCTRMITIQKTTEVRRVGWRRKQILDDLRNRRRYWELKEEAEDWNKCKQKFINRT